MSKDKQTSTVNPYTFIPLRGYKDPLKFKRELEPTEVAATQSVLTGVIECELTAITELAIPDAQMSYPQEDKGKMQYYPFFTVDKKAIVPGSSIRGSVRSIFEALTNSCLHVNNNRFYRRSALKKAGVLVCTNGEYYLKEADRYPIYEKDDNNTFESVKQYSIGDSIAVEIKKKNGAGKAYVVNSGGTSGLFLRVNIFTNEGSETGGSSHPSVFVKKQSAAKRINPLYIDCLDENISMYDLEEKPNPITKEREQKDVGKAYRDCFDAMRRGEKELPVWYLENDGVYEFAPSQNSRSVYPVQVKDYLDKVGLSQCEIPSNCCPACNLFGMVSTEGNGAKASRVRFTDAIAVNPFETKSVVFPAQMGPRISAFEFYLTCANVESKHSFALNDENVKLAGRKLYWHHQDSLSATLGVIDEERPDLQAEYEMAPRDSKFEFKVYFDNISELELNELIYALSLGDYYDESTDSHHYHKLGHGKPLGLGSVDISIKDVKTRVIDDACYIMKSDKSWMMSREDLISKLSSVASIDAMTSFGAVSADTIIDYPRNENGEIFGWFADNRDDFESNGKGWYYEVLTRGKPGFDWEVQKSGEVVAPKKPAGSKPLNAMQIALLQAQEKKSKNNKKRK